MGTTRWEKHNIAEEIPQWEPSLCTQYNHYYYVAACSHAAIRAKVVPPEALGNAPAGLASLEVKARDTRGQKYVLQVAPEDCTGCNLCIEVCPAKDRQDPEIKTINMASRLVHEEEEKGASANLAICWTIRRRPRHNSWHGTPIIFWLISPSGSSAATAGLMISALAVWIM